MAQTDLTLPKVVATNLTNDASTITSVTKDKAASIDSKKTVIWNGHAVKKGNPEACCTVLTGFFLALTLILIIAGAGSRNLKCIHAAVAFGIFGAISYTCEKVMQYKGRHNFTLSVRS